MPISITCECGKRLTVKDELAGKRVRCPGCQATMTVAAAKGPAPAAAAPKPKAVVGAPQKNGAPPPRAAAPPPPPPPPSLDEEEEEDQHDEEMEEKPVRRPAPEPEEEEQHEDEHHDEEEEEHLDDDEFPKKKKPKVEEEEQEEHEEEEQFDEDEPPKKKKPKDDFEDDELEDEPVGKKKSARKAAVEEEDEEQEDEEQEERPKGKKKPAKGEDDDEEEEEIPKKGKGKDKGKDKGKGKSKPEVPPAMFEYTKYLIKAKGKGEKKTFEILDADSEEVVATAKNATPFLASLLGSVVYEIKDEATGNTAFTLSRTGFLFKKDQVVDAKGKVVGRVKSKILSLAGGFHVYDGVGEHICEIKGKLLKSEYKFLTPDGDEMGSVSKTWGGVFKSMMTGAGTYGVKVEADYAGDSKIKMIIIAATIAVETIFQAKKKSGGGGGGDDGGGDDE